MNVYYCSKCKCFIEEHEHKSGLTFTHKKGVTRDGETYKYTHKYCVAKSVTEIATEFGLWLGNKGKKAKGEDIDELFDEFWSKYGQNF